MACEYWQTVHEVDSTLHSQDEPVSVELQKIHQRSVYFEG